MKINWLGTAALTFAIGVGSSAVLAQQQTDSPQKREQGSHGERQSLPSRETPAAREQRSGGGLKDRTAQERAKEPRRDEAATRREQTKEPQGKETQAKESQAKEPQLHEQKQPTRQSQERPNRGERPAAGVAQQSQNEQKAREAQQAADAKRQSEREELKKQDNRTAGTAKPSEARQQQSKQQPPRGEHTPATQQTQDEKQPQGRQQAAQPSASPSKQQAAGPGNAGETRQRENVGQAPDQSTRRTSMVNNEQRTQIVDRLQRERDTWRDTRNLNIHVNVGERLPERVRPRPLPPDIVRIAPEYRDYDYTMIENEIAIVDPRTRDVVDVIGEPGPGRTAERFSRDGSGISLSSEQREMLKQAAQSSLTVGSTSSGGPGQACVTMRRVPDELARSNPDLDGYRYVAIGDQIVLVDPRQQKIVDVIE